MFSLPGLWSESYFVVNFLWWFHDNKLMVVVILSTQGIPLVYAPYFCHGSTLSSYQCIMYSTRSIHKRIEWYFIDVWFSFRIPNYGERGIFHSEITHILYVKVYYVVICHEMAAITKAFFVVIPQSHFTIATCTWPWISKMFIYNSHTWLL